MSRAREVPAHAGRAGMRYRDLIPGRLSGRVIGSLISIARGGPVADWVHFHRVAWQSIYCRAGWVTVVYEDQGPPFTMRPGDCVLQPPEIRHRVLESSSGLEVIEFAAPAEHETVADPALALPTASVRPEREFSGQRFVRHVAHGAAWAAAGADGFESRDLGLLAASAGCVRARVLRGGPDCGNAAERAHDFALFALVVLEGEALLATRERGSTRLERGDAAVVPPGARFTLARAAPGLELLEVCSRSL